jgi:EmrB/QacA subfamily drug resistance transporter
MTTPTIAASFLSTRRGKLILALLCAVGFLDFLDISIVNVALPSIRHELHFSVQSLQWVASGYLLTYGGFLLLGGRAADLVGRRRVLVTGIVVFGLSSLTAGLAPSSGVLVGARLAQGGGAAMMSPAALSILTTTFNQGTDRLKAFGVWGAMSGGASAVGVLLGGILAGGPGWRWVFFINIPVCVIVIVAAFRLIGAEHHPARRASFDARGAVLVTAAMLLLVYGLVKAPAIGWGSTETITALAAAGLAFGLFAVNESRHPSPLIPMSVFRVKGLPAADATQVIAMAGFFSMFFFLTLYMQTVLGYSPTRAGAAYVPVAVTVAISAAICSRLFARTGTRPLIAVGALVAAGGTFWLSQLPVHGSYLTGLLPGLLIMSAGLGAVFVGVQTAANAGVPPDQAGLAAALINASFQVGAALGLAIFSAIATSHTQHLLHEHVAISAALTGGFRWALTASSVFLLAAAPIALRTANTRGEPAGPAGPAGSSDPASAAGRSAERSDVASATDLTVARERQ